MINVIVNADDYGIDENRTRAILEGFKRGFVTHTTALVTMPYFEESIGLIKSSGYLGQMGLHFNLTEGRALTENMRKCRFFCNSEGYFTASFYNVPWYRFRFPNEVRPVVEAEARAQMQCFRTLGGTSNHMDSHHHIHTFASIARIVLPIAKEYGFTSFRLSRNLGHNLSFLKRVYKFWYNHAFLQGATSWSDYFCDFNDFKDYASHIESGKTVEIMVHPMYGSLKDLSLTSELTDSGRSMAADGQYYDKLGGVIQIIYPK